MKMIVAVALALVAFVAAAPVENEVIPILRTNYDQSPEGAYQSGYETGNGIKSETTGELKTVPDEDNKPQTVLVARGSYSYTSPEGFPIAVSWVADENGFQAEGDSIPKPARR